MSEDKKTPPSPDTGRSEAPDVYSTDPTSDQELPTITETTRIIHDKKSPTTPGRQSPDTSKESD